ncbi:hypothetical protein SMC3_08705, partial [Candidatus Cryosericum hinesii]
SAVTSQAATRTSSSPTLPLDTGVSGITTGIKGDADGLWTIAIGAGDTLRFNVDSVTTVTRVTPVFVKP